MNKLLYFLQPAARKPRYSIRPFYTSLIVLSALATASWLLSTTGKEHVHFTQAGVAEGISLFKREAEPEVLLSLIFCNMCKG